MTESATKYLIDLPRFTARRTAVLQSASIRQHTSAYVAYVSAAVLPSASIRQHTSAWVAYVSMGSIYQHG